MGKPQLFLQHIRKTTHFDFKYLYSKLQHLPITNSKSQHVGVCHEYSCIVALSVNKRMQLVLLYNTLSIK